MHCPKCEHPDYRPNVPCANCQFSGDPALIEELGRVRWLLAELDTWRAHEAHEVSKQRLRRRYAARQRDLEILLGLRLPPFTQEEAQQAWLELARYEALKDRLAEWLAVGWLDPAHTQKTTNQVTAKLAELHERLEGHSRPDTPPTDEEALSMVHWLLNWVDDLKRRDGFVTRAAAAAARAPLRAEKKTLETRRGLRPAPGQAKPVEAISTAILADKRPPEELPAAEPAEPAPSEVSAPSLPPTPWRERLWRTLASERTLRAVLFLGIFLLFSAAISFVGWGWRSFSPLLRVAIPAGFTALFFFMGWYVRTHMSLYRSGLALEAIAALLIPIDFYTAFVNLNMSPDFWPSYWLIASLICLGAYLVSALVIQSGIFGYLVGAAAGSAILAAIEIGRQFADLSRDWSSAGLSLLAACLVMLATVLAQQAGASRWRVLAGPFRYLALLTAGVLMPLTMGWRYVDRSTFDTLHIALTINWWLGGFIFVWGAIYYRSRSLGLLAAISLPVAVYLVQAALFDRVGVNSAWHALGLASLTPLYFWAGHRWLGSEDPIIHDHGRTATGWGIALTAAAALWSLTDLTSGMAAAASHTVLVGALILAAALWNRPSILYTASTLSLTAATFAMTGLDLTIPQLSVGWVSLALAHVLIALRVGRRSTRFASPLVLAGYVIAALALLPPLFPFNRGLTAYVLGHWIGMAIWGACLAHAGRPGFAGRAEHARLDGIFHWLAAWPLPIWVCILFVHWRPADFSLPLALAALAWGLVALSVRLKNVRGGAYRLPWYLAGLLTSIAAPVAARAITPDGLAWPLCLLSAGLLYWSDALAGQWLGGQRAVELIPAAAVTAGGGLLLLDRLHVPRHEIMLIFAILLAFYFLIGLWAERRRSAIFALSFWSPLYVTAHALSLIMLGMIGLRPFEELAGTPWTDEMRLWEAFALLVLGIVYGLYAWGRYKERWAHVAAWLGVAGGGLLVMIYSQGRGSSAAKAALMAAAFILAERALHWLWHARSETALASHMFPSRLLTNRRRAFFRLAWALYKRPLLIAGWVVSAGSIVLALIRNLLLLGGGRLQQTWAAIGLLITCALYALSARIFRRARFIWLAAALSVAPWTILSNLGWFTAWRPTLPGFAISWTVLAWVLFVIALLIGRHVPHAYTLPLRVVPHCLLPLSLLWGVANVETSRWTFGLAIGLYGLSAWRDWQDVRRAQTMHSIAQGPPRWKMTRFLYPALGLLPVWCVYLLAWLLPPARHEHYGLMLLAFGPLGLIAGRWWLYRSGRSYGLDGHGLALPAYLTGYLADIVGAILVGHIAPLFALALLFDALLALASARLFRNPLWVYPAAVLTPFSLLIALDQAGVAINRSGWWLIGLAAVYLALAWMLRRVRLGAYANSPLAIGLALIALGLLPSSRDQVGALWGYGSAALLYALVAFWLRQPLLLTPACALALVPYAVALRRSPLLPDYYGLALFPGALAALAIGRRLDRRRGGWRDFPWPHLSQWPAAMGDRLLGWWGLPFYTLGIGMAAASPFFTHARSWLSALNCLLLMAVLGWATARFRLRGWLLLAVLAGHLAIVYTFDALDWWAYPSFAWARFLPVTVVTALTGLWIERQRSEGSPLAWSRMAAGWSRPLYLVLIGDILIAQLSCLSPTDIATMVTLTHALLIAFLASIWVSPGLAYGGAIWGIVAMSQWLTAWQRPYWIAPIALSGLALGYGVVGYGLTLWKRWGHQHAVPSWLAIWEKPLQHNGLGLSWFVLLLAAVRGIDLAAWTVRAMLGLPFRQIVEVERVRMAVGVLSLLGLFYVAAAAAYRRMRLGYLAVGMLLAGWTLYAFYIQQWDGLARVQWYAIPAGLYLLGIAALERQRGSRDLARWLDYAAMLLMMGTLFWQTLLFGWRYALLLGMEGFLAFWWGSARRLRRFFYAGMVGVILATLGQLINSLQSVNQWIVFGIIGLMLVGIVALVERRLEVIRATLQEVLEDWE